MNRWQVMKAMVKLNDPVIQQVKYDMDSIETLKKATQTNRETEKLMFDYPTVYIIYDKRSKQDYEVYVGETNDIERRTKQHLTVDVNKRDDFKRFLKSAHSEMLVIAHDHFNKSLTMDVENTLMHYMTGAPCVTSLDNRRENQQNHYYPESELKQIFNRSWEMLGKHDENLFPIQNVIRDTALFKVAPFYKLTDEQNNAIKHIMDSVSAVLAAPDDGTNHLIVIEGEAGAGKTVLMSTIFYLINQYEQEDDHPEFKDGVSALIVNHQEQIKIYQDIAAKLNLAKEAEVLRPTKFINQHSYKKIKGEDRRADPSKRIDVAIIDEAHLLLTQGDISYSGKNQLQDIRNCSRVTIAVFDPNQVLKTRAYLEPADVQRIESEALRNNDLIQLHDQMRIQASDSTIQWLRTLLNEHQITQLAPDSNYEIKLFSSAKAMYEAIKAKNANWQEVGLSRVVATFDWDWHAGDKSKVWQVTAGDLTLPWNYGLKPPEGMKDVTWPEQPQTIDEVGSTFTVQGFDLNYVGVIIGPSVKYRDGRIVFDKSASKNVNVTNHRTLADESSADVSEELLANELNVLMTRGVHGLYLYVVDEALKRKLSQVIGIVADNTDK